MKSKLFSITASDCRWDYYRGSGAGGQKRNKTSNCVRCTHVPSGAVGKAEDGRSQRHNKETAFARMAATEALKKWTRIETARRTGQMAKIEEEVDRNLQPSHLRVEVRQAGKWETA